jgi:hypothetical protein
MFCGVKNTHYTPMVTFKASPNLTHQIFYKNPTNDSLELRKSIIKEKPSKLSPKYESILNYVNSLDYEQFDIRRACDTLKNYTDKDDYHTYIINYKYLVDSGDFRTETIYEPYLNDDQVDTGFDFVKNQKALDKFEANTIYKILIAKTLIAVNNLNEYSLDPKKYKLSKVTKDEKFALLVVHMNDMFKELSKSYIEISKKYPENSEKKILAEEKAAEAYKYGDVLYNKIFKVHFPIDKDSKHLNIDHIFRRFCPVPPKWKSAKVGDSEN